MPKRKRKGKPFKYSQPTYKDVECRECGSIVTISSEAKSGLCPICTQRNVLSKFPIEVKKISKPSGKPRGWHWMLEFVDTDGTYYEKGKEVPEKKDKYPPTKIKPPKKKLRRKTKAEKEDAEQRALLKRHKQKKNSQREVKKIGNYERVEPV